MNFLFEFVEKAIGAITEENGRQISADDVVKYYYFRSAELFEYPLNHYSRPYFVSSHLSAAALVDDAGMIPYSNSYAQEICPDRLELFHAALTSHLPVREMKTAEIPPLEKHEPKGYS